VKVVTGDSLAELDTTGTLTQKYQARLVQGTSSTELICGRDTRNLLDCVNNSKPSRFSVLPSSHPDESSLLPIAELFQRLKKLVGNTFHHVGHDQERNRGSVLHRLACEALGYLRYADDGQFPDVRNQLLEIKLQTSSTIDLGLVCPDSNELLDVPQIAGIQPRHCDVRYCLFSATVKDENVHLTHLFLTTGESFFTRFSKCGGKVLNRKLQLRLPAEFFGIHAEGF
jgi:hypothetical protein